jgi:phenylalanyl-tRNA synthetase beta chain
MKFSYQWIKELSGVTLDATEAAELLSSKAFEVKEASDDVLDIDILPNRPDALSHLGVARELAALAGQRFVAPVYEYRTGTHPAVRVDIEDAAACPRYSALVVRGLRVGPSPDWLRERLERCGLNSINNVVDVTNYVMLELGQPMHAFDIRRVDRIIVRCARTEETLQALDEARTTYALTPEVLVIADGTVPLAIAGVKGGANSGISDDTTDVLLEAANFDPVSIRATARFLELRTDASVRFSFGVDPNLTAPALMRAAELLAQVAEGRADGDIIDAYPTPVHPWRLKLETSHVRAVLGVQIADGQIRGILTSLGFEVETEDDALMVTVPTRRLDIRAPEDLIEEVGRVYGYDSIPSVAPVVSAYDERSWTAVDEASAWDEYATIRERAQILRILAGAGYSEVYNYSFLSDELAGVLKLSGMHELAQPQSDQYRWLRTSLVPRLLVNLRDNLRYSGVVRILEHGHVFAKVGQGREDTRLALAMASRGGQTELFYELKGALDVLFRRLGIGDMVFDDAEPMPFDAGAVNATLTGRRAVIRTETGAVIGFIGMVHPRIADALKLKGTAAVAELDLRALIVHAQQEREFEPLPKYPAVVRDIAVMVEADVKIDDILQVIQGADAAGLVQDVDVFDIFVPTGKEKLGAEDDKPDYGKSVAFHVTYRAADHTLTDAQAQAAEDAIKVALQERLGARIR